MKKKRTTHMTNRYAMSKPIIATIIGVTIGTVIGGFILHWITLPQSRISYSRPDYDNTCYAGGSGSFTTQVRNVGEATGKVQFEVTASNLILYLISDPSYTGENELSWWFYLIEDESRTTGFRFKTESIVSDDQPDYISYTVKLNNQVIRTCYYVYDNQGKFVLTD